MCHGEEPEFKPREQEFDRAPDDLRGECETIEALARIHRGTAQATHQQLAQQRSGAVQVSIKNRSCGCQLVPVKNPQNPMVAFTKNRAHTQKFSKKSTPCD